MDMRSLLKRLNYALITPPQLKDNGDFERLGYIDTQPLGAGAVGFLLATGAMDTDIGSVAEDEEPKVVECDTTDGTYTDVTGAVLDDVIGDDQGDTLRAVVVDLSKTHKRYMTVATPHSGDGTTGANLAIIAIGFPAETLPASAAQAGLAELIEA